MASKKHIIRVISALNFLSDYNGEEQEEWANKQLNLGTEVFDLNQKNIKLENEKTALEIEKEELKENAAQLQNACNDLAIQNKQLRDQLSTHVQVMAENATLYKRIAELDLKIESESKKHLPKNDTFTAKFSGGAEINLTIPQKEN